MSEKTQPLFEINEMVILQSVYHPEENGVYTISSRKWVFRPGISNPLPHYHWCYTLNGGSKEWHERVIKKFHTKGNDDYQTVIKKIKNQSNTNA